MFTSLIGLPFHLLQGGRIFRVCLESERNAPEGRTLREYFVSIQEEGNTWQRIVGIVDLINRSRSPIHCHFLVLRSLFSSLTDTNGREVNIDPINVVELDNGHPYKKSELRQAVAEYIEDRYAQEWDEPFRVLEIITAIPANPRDLISMLDSFGSNEILRFHPSNALQTALRQDWHDALVIELRYNPAKKDLVHEWANTDAESKKQRTQIVVKDPADNPYYKLVSLDCEFNGVFSFVIMPFNEEEFPQHVYTNILKPTAESVLGFQCLRNDDDKSKSQIDDIVFSHIAKSNLVIAELSTGNLGVVYEMGIAHAWGKPVIPLARRGSVGSKLHFDYNKFPTVFWNDEQDLQVQLTDRLNSHKLHSSNIS